MADTTASAEPLVTPTDLGDAATAALREMILSGAVSPGDRLVETDLSAKFGTSRGPVRDAFKTLEEAGLVRSVPRRGTFVASLSTVDIDEIYTLRAALEQLAVTQFASNATPAQLDDLNDALDELARAQQAGDRRASAAADMRFHRSIVAGAGHRRLIEAWDRLGEQTMLLMTQLADVAPTVQAAAGDHRQIADAIAAGDATTAAAALRDHLDAARRAMHLAD